MITKAQMSITWIFMIPVLWACQLTPEPTFDPVLHEQGHGGSGPKESRETLIQGMTNEETELKLAKLWARVDEMETRLIRQQEKVRLLERGLMLGIVPLGLRDSDAASKNLPISESAPWDEPPPPAKKEQQEQKNIAKSRSDGDERSFRQLISEAQAKFNAGRYGQAIADYQTVHERFPDYTTQGQHLYWIGLSWYYLKEDDLAAENLEQLISRFHGSSWLPQANFYLAKVELRRGLRQKALQRFRSVVEQFGDKDVAEMARYEISQLQESL